MDDKEIFLAGKAAFRTVYSVQGLVLTLILLFLAVCIRNLFLTQGWFEKENAICPLWIALLLSGAIRLKDKKLSSK